MDDFDTQAPDITPDVPAASTPEASPSATLSDALDNAFDNVFSDEPEMQSGRARDQSGRFAKGEAKGEVTAKPSEVSAKSGEVAAKSSEVAPTAIEQAINPDEPPARLSAEAKAQWGALPPAVKADVHRTIREMQGGIEKYRTEATRWQTDVAPYETLAQQYGMDIKGVLADYEGMARMMATNPVQVFDTLAKRPGPIALNSRGEPWTADGFKSSFADAKRGLEITGLVFHGLRHTAASRLYEAGNDVDDIMAVTGHRTRKMVEHYIKHADRKMRSSAAIARLPSRTKGA